MTTLFRILLLVTLPTITWAEGVSWNLGLLSNVGRGDQLGLEYNYTENFITGSLEKGPWYVDLKYEYSNPPEYGYEFNGMDQMLLRYTHNKFSVEVGDILAVFGRGLGLNLYEDQFIDFDNGIKGLRFTSILQEAYEIDFIAGVNKNYRFYSPSSDLRQPDGEAEYSLAGLQTTFNGKTGFWNISPYFIGSQMSSKYLWNDIDPSLGIIVGDTVNQIQHILQSGWSQYLYGETWDVFFEYNRTWKAFDYPLVKQDIQQTDGDIILQNSTRDYLRQGQALNMQLNWFPEWGSAMFEYKRYLNGPELSEDGRNPLLLATKPLPWQLGPTGIRQHDIRQLANVSHPINYGDELGWDLEVRRSLTYQWELTLNVTQASQARDSRDLSESPGYIPLQSINRNPWQEYFAELEYTGESLSQRMLFAYTRSTLSGSSSAEITEHFTLVPAYLSWHARNELVITTVLGVQNSMVHGETYLGDELAGHDYQSFHFVSVVDIKRKYSAAILWDSSNDPNLNGGKHELQHWVNGELSLKPVDGLWILASYGREKGGVRCTGGVCRVINPFEGFRLTVEWRL